MRMSEYAGAVGKGLIAGMAGTAAMTLSTTAEMKLTGRGASDTPARAVGKLLQIQPRNDEGRKRLSNAVHWSYGTSWGVARGLLAAAGLGGPAASVLHFASVWGASLAMLPSLGVAPPPTKWGWRELATDALHHVVYAAATGAAYTWIDRH